MATSNRQVVGSYTPSMPPFGVHMYCLATVVGAVVMTATAWGISPAFGLGVTVVGVLHLLSVYGLRNMYLVGLDLAIALNVVSVIGAVAVGSFVGIVLPIAFVAYLKRVRPYYV